MATNKVLNDKLREKYLEIISKVMGEVGEEVLRTNSNEIAFPCVDEEGNDKYVVLTVKVPTGSRDGEAYDGYSMAEDYAIKCKNKADAAEKKKAEKEKKIARDEKKRKEKKNGEN